MDMVGGIVEVLKRHQKQLDEHEQSFADLLTAVERLDEALRALTGVSDDEEDAERLN